MWGIEFINEGKKEKGEFHPSGGRFSKAEGDVIPDTNNDGTAKLIQLLLFILYHSSFNDHSRFSRERTTMLIGKHNIIIYEKGNVTKWKIINTIKELHNPI